MNPIRILE